VAVAHLPDSAVFLADGPPCLVGVRLIASGVDVVLGYTCLCKKNAAHEQRIESEDLDAD